MENLKSPPLNAPRISRRAVILGVLALSGGPGRAFAVEPAMMSISADQARESVQWLVDLAIPLLPPRLEGDDHWGDTQRVWTGVKIKQDGLKLKTHRRFKQLRHGRWIKYELTLPPDLLASKALVIHSVEPTSDQRWRIHASITTPLKFDCRIERWNLGVQWYSVSVQGDLRVNLQLVATSAFTADYTEVPPAFQIEPSVEHARLALEHFEVDRISKIGGDAAEEFGKVIEEVLQRLWLEKENARLAERLNRAVVSKSDRLRFSLADWFATWNG